MSNIIEYFVPQPGHLIILEEDVILPLHRTGVLVSSWLSCFVSVPSNFKKTKAARANTTDRYKYYRFLEQVFLNDMIHLPKGTALKLKKVYGTESWLQIIQPEKLNYNLRADKNFIIKVNAQEYHYLKYDLTLCRFIKNV